MSYSTFVVKLDGYDGTIAKVLPYDTDTLREVLPSHITILEDIFPRKHFVETPITNIVISDCFPDENDYSPERVAYVAYHHGEDPSIMEMIVELDAILKLFGIKGYF